jgi:hypothetical protein
MDTGIFHQKLEQLRTKLDGIAPLQQAEVSSLLLIDACQVKHTTNFSSASVSIIETYNY